MTPGAPSVSGLPSLTPQWGEPSAPEPAVVERLTQALRLPRPVCAILAARGVVEIEEAKRFLRPRLEHLHDPALLADGPQAARRIARAIGRGETVLVHGDYDVDGISATALYTRWLRRLGAQVVPFVPNRLRDGYDFGPSGLSEARRAGATLVVTADCGTVASDAVRDARAEGIDVVVTDHHTVGDAPAPATHLVNPQRPDCGYPDTRLCGTGVAFKVCQLVAREMGADEAELLEYLDLVALATVADLVPLQGENRVLVRFGLRRFAQSRIPGLVALLEAAGVDAEGITAGALGFTVAPRINAVGRMGEAGDALRLLLTEDAEEARRLAGLLDETNRVRQDEDRRTLEEALEMLAGTYDPNADFGVVLAREGWHPGVIGIVASRVVEHIHRPVVMVALDGDRGRGSARSIPGFDLYEALSTCRTCMRRFGGHKQAAGMDVDAAAVPGLRNAFNEAARARLAGHDLRPSVRTDLELPLAEANLELVHWLQYLGPHGIGNPRPVFLARGVRAADARVVGERHLKTRLATPGVPAVDAIGFGLADRLTPDSVGEGPHDALLKLERNEYRGVTRLQARLLDLRPSGAGAPPGEGG